ncbi:hypothetical protein BDV23DRAFT_145292 [Aspergillus alliaceus]|uniref:Uncharacterized protein n=1 Tax=Petromyces alliaceus TaxID=209559 RepID=A0A5N7CNA2_PETAA|nr:hypothetical protein BDV23DRAFT_145292 [Aspergillus alliaceus]
MAPTTEEYPPDAPAYPSQKVAVIFPGPSEIKHIHTERLILRPFQLDNKEDAAGLFRTRCQQEVISWMKSRGPCYTPPRRGSYRA